MKKTLDYTEVRDYRFDNMTTMEKLELESSGMCYNAMVKFGENIIFAGMNFRGETLCGVYEFIETEEETGMGDIELRLSLVKVSEEVFEDTGHAIKWGLEFLNK